MKPMVSVFPSPQSLPGLDYIDLWDAALDRNPPCLKRKPHSSSTQNWLQFHRPRGAAYLDFFARKRISAIATPAEGEAWNVIVRVKVNFVTGLYLLKWGGPVEISADFLRLSRALLIFFVSAKWRGTVHIFGLRFYAPGPSQG